MLCGKEKTSPRTNVGNLGEKISQECSRPKCDAQTNMATEHTEQRSTSATGVEGDRDLPRLIYSAPELDRLLQNIEHDKREPPAQESQKHHLTLCEWLEGERGEMQRLCFWYVSGSHQLTWSGISDDIRRAAPSYSSVSRNRSWQKSTLENTEILIFLSMYVQQYGLKASAIA